ncbi:hypothetical protein Ancab_002983 [Ancistrocladus abbreviatus]
MADHYVGKFKYSSSEIQVYHDVYFRLVSCVPELVMRFQLSIGTNFTWGYLKGGCHWVGAGTGWRLGETLSSKVYSQCKDKNKPAEVGLRNRNQWDLLCPMGSGGHEGLPVPYIVISNKVDMSTKEVTTSSSGNLVDVVRQWVEKQGLLASSEELPLTETFPGNGALLAAAKQARFDKEAVMKFLRMLIRRRYFSDEIPSSKLSSVQRPIQQSDEISIDDNRFYNNMSLKGDPYKYNVLAPLPAQHSPAPPSTLYPQLSVLTPEAGNIPGHNVVGSTGIIYTRPKRTDINV